MKKYTAPTMSINKFHAENILIGGSTLTNTEYVTGLEGIVANQKAQVNLNEMKTIIKFSF